MTDNKPTDSVIGLFLRIYWTMIGNGVLIILAVLPLTHPNLPVAPLLVAYLLSVLALVAVRYVDIRFCGGQTRDGDPADMGHWKRYASILVPAAAAILGCVWLLKVVI